MNPYKKLVTNSVIFGIGNLGSRLVSLILVPLYSYYLSTEQFGVADLIITTVSLLLPIVSFSVNNAILRFIMDKSESRKEILSNSILIAIAGFILLFLMFPLLSMLNLFGDYLIYFYAILLLTFLERFLGQYARSIGMLKVYSFNGILLSLTLGFSNILLLMTYDFQLLGYLSSYIIANLISVIFLTLTTKFYREFSLKSFNIKVIRKILVYSVPMIPNSIMWWLINASSRYFILFYIGVSANGIFGIASKIPSVISLLDQIFTQAWQMSAIEEYGSKEKDKFYSNIFLGLSTTLFIGTSMLLVVLKLMFQYVFSAEFFISWQVVPFLILGTVFSSLSGFLGTNYIAAKKTIGVFKTSVYGGIISIVLNLILIPNFGIIGAGISSWLSFMSMFLIRYLDTKKFISIKIEWKKLCLNLFIILLQTLTLFMSLTLINEIIINCILFLILLYFNKSVLEPLIQFLIRKLRAIVRS